MKDVNAKKVIIPKEAVYKDVVIVGKLLYLAWNLIKLNI